MSLSYSPSHFTSKNIDDLKQAFNMAVRELIEESRLSPLRRSQRDVLDESDVQWRRSAQAVSFEPIEDAFPLTPLQSGLLFHTLLEPSSGLYVEQLEIRVTGGESDVGALLQAFESVAEQHKVLRGRVVTEGVSQPLFVIPVRNAMSHASIDLRALSDDLALARVDLFFARDRERGFDPTEPLSRLTILQMDDGHWR